ncbi:hypothetical protein DFH08DRAFT_717431, partial [Mycena albidolilacea]
SVSYSFSMTSLTVRVRANLVRWVTESNRPITIVEDETFWHIFLAGRPTTSLPSRFMLTRDIKKAFPAASAQIHQENLKLYEVQGAVMRDFDGL